MRAVQRYTKYVLLIDDDPADLLLFRRLLERGGFKVIATSKPEDALAAVVEGDIGCVITDQLMPVSGYELESVIHGVRSDIGLIFLSGTDTPQHPLPQRSAFITKSDKQGLLNQVTLCMSRWQTA
jgi:FixJ family two-component response regulator